MTSPRPASDRDAAALRPHGIEAQPGCSVLVAERTGAIAGAAVYAEQPFESEHLGRHAARIERLAAWPAEAAEAPEVLAELVAGCRARLEADGVGFVSCRLAEDDRAAIRALGQGGFEVVECLLTLGCDLPAEDASAAAGIEIAGPEDAEACAELAARAFHTDRFHSDPAIPDAAADGLKAAWARNDCAGRADAVLIIREAGRLVGFNACFLRDEEAVIDLIAVAPQAQGRGLGRRLVEGALAHYPGRAQRMMVGTQSRNYASLALYAACGFRIEASALTFHAHLGDGR